MPFSAALCSVPRETSERWRWGDKKLLNYGRRLVMSSCGSTSRVQDPLGFFFVAVSSAWVDLKRHKTKRRSASWINLRRDEMSRGLNKCRWLCWHDIVAVSSHKNLFFLSLWGFNLCITLFLFAQLMVKYLTSLRRIVDSQF